MAIAYLPAKPVGTSIGANSGFSRGAESAEVAANHGFGPGRRSCGGRRSRDAGPVRWFTADNDVFVYLSTSASQRGTLIGSGNNWQSTFYVTPASLTPGTTYYLNVEAINGDSGSYSAGGFIGDFTLSGGAPFANGQSELLTSSVGWLVSYNDSNSSYVAQPWLQPLGSAVSEGTNGVGPWGTVSGVSASANWIWASDLQSGNGSAPGDQCAACTVDFQTSFTTAAVPEPASAALFGAGLAALGVALRKRRLRRAV